MYYCWPNAHGRPPTTNLVGSCTFQQQSRFPEHPLMPNTPPVLSAISLASVALLACGSVQPSAPDVPTVPGQRCQVKTSEERPLIVEWDPSSRNDVEALLKHEGVLVVRYDGCEMELLRRCHAPGTYKYAAATRQNESVHISTMDELYARMPIGAVGLEGELDRGRELRLEMSIVGKYTSRDVVRNRQRFNGVECGKATHVVVGLTAGAFEMTSGQSASESAGASAGLIGGAGSHTREEQTLRRAGKKSNCDTTSLEDTGPPAGCGALLRLELMPIQCPTGQDCEQSEAGPAATPGGPDGQNAPADAAFTKLALDAAEAVLAAVQGGPPTANLAVTFAKGPSDARKGFATLGSDVQVLLVGAWLGLLRFSGNQTPTAITANYTVHPNGRGRWGQVRIINNADEEGSVDVERMPAELKSIYGHLTDTFEGSCELAPASMQQDFRYLTPDVGELCDFDKGVGDARVADPALLPAACEVAKAGSGWKAGYPMFEVAFGNAGRMLVVAMRITHNPAGGYELTVEVPAQSERRHD